MPQVKVSAEDHARLVALADHRPLGVMVTKALDAYEQVIKRQQPADQEAVRTTN